MLSQWAAGDVDGLGDVVAGGRVSVAVTVGWTAGVVTGGRVSVAVTVGRGQSVPGLVDVVAGRVSVAVTEPM